MRGFKSQSELHSFISKPNHQHMQEALLSQQVDSKVLHVLWSQNLSAGGLWRRAKKQRPSLDLVGRIAHLDLAGGAHCCSAVTPEGEEGGEHSPGMARPRDTLPCRTQSCLLGSLGVCPA